MRAMPRLTQVLDAQNGHLFPWSPVAYAIGISIFFTQKTEPSVFILICAGLGALLFLVLAMRVNNPGFVPAFIGIMLCLAGFANAGWRTHAVAAPVLDWRYYGPIEGRVIGLDRSASDALRVTLDRVRLSKIPNAKLPTRVRVSLHGSAAEQAPPIPGSRVMTTGHLSPPGGPVEPGGFDFQRHSWYNKLGGVGYTRVPMVQSGPVASDDARARIFQIRMAVSRFVMDRLPKDVGGFAAAVTSGDRSGMGQEALTALRASNLAHLLAISGLHMGLLTGFVFAALRTVLVIIPGVGVQYPTRRLAALGALIAGAVYFGLSGGNVATERAFIMATVALCAVMLDRRAVSLRAVAIAAMIVLTLRPEALLGPGFQMSFAATTALVAVYNTLRGHNWPGPKVLQPAIGVFLTSAVAGLATAPIAAAHFNAVSHYGLLANILSVPVMGTIVVPAAVVAACLSILGLAQLGLEVMGLGLRWILEVAHFVSNLPGARSFVVGPDPHVLPMIVLGGLVMALVHGRTRLFGAIPMLVGLALWPISERPDVLIAENGGIVGVMTDAGRAVSRAKGSGFVAKNWLENDGERMEQRDAFTRWTTAWPEQEKPVTRANIAGVTLRHVTGKKSAAGVAQCADSIVVSNAQTSIRDANCLVFDPHHLKFTGSVAIEFDAGDLKITTARDIAGDRLWSRWPDQ